MKTAVYTIAKNEAENVERFMKSLDGVDEVVVVDTGSTDNTVKLLKQHGATVYTKTFKPFDFGKARQYALDRVGDVDMCISMDLDETLEPGWKKELERLFNEGFELIDYTYIESKDKTRSLRSKIHTRKGFKWDKSIHEIVVPTDDRSIKRSYTFDIKITHHRTTPNNYIEQLTEFIKDNPDVADSYIQRGADYLNHGKYQEAIDDYKHYLKLTVGETEYMIKTRRCFACVAIAQAHYKLDNNTHQVLTHLLQAVSENPDSREAWTYLADCFGMLNNHAMAYGCAMNALAITQPGMVMMDEVWGDYPKQLANRSLAMLSDRFMRA